jgi:hypothetical protein
MENHTKRIRKARRQGLAAVGRDILPGPRARLSEPSRVASDFESRRRPVVGRTKRKAAEVRRRRRTTR